jgi:hypothetical protein
MTKKLYHGKDEYNLICYKDKNDKNKKPCMPACTLVL